MVVEVDNNSSALNKGISTAAIEVVGTKVRTYCMYRMNHMHTI